MVVRTEDPRAKFRRRVNNLEAKANSLLSAPAPGASWQSPKRSIMENGFIALFFGMLVLIATRLFMFHVPELVTQVSAYGLSPGLIGAFAFPLAVALLAVWLAGQMRNELWVPAIIGIGFMLICETYVLLVFPEIWGTLYSPDFVTYVEEDGGSLSSWLDAQVVTEPPVELLDVQEAIAVEPGTEAANE
jgi:hypothetical protein